MRRHDRDEAYSLFVASRWPHLVRAAVLLGCSREAAEDLVQEALVKCYVHWTKVDGADDRDAYVHRLLVNTHRTAMRRRWRGEQPTAELPDTPVPDTADSLALTDAVLAALSRLGTGQREVVVLRHYVGLSEAHTAAALGVPAGTVKSRLARALVQLARDPAMIALKETS